MSIEGIENLSLILKQPILDQINYVPEETPDLFFNRLVTNNDLELETVDFRLIKDLQLSGAGEVLTDYVQVFQDSGAYDKFVDYVVRNYPIDESTADEMTLFAVWKSLYIVPWENEETDLRTVRAYIYTTLKQFARNHMQKFFTQTDRRSFELLEEENRLDNSVMSTPEVLIIQYEELELMIDELLEAANIREDRHLPVKRNLLRFLGLNYSLSDIIEELDLSPLTAKKWIRRFKECGLVNTKDRIAVRVDGSWRWNNHTAEVILSNSRVVAYLTEQEKQVLVVLRKEGSLGKVAASGRIEVTLSNLFRSIRMKFRSAGMDSHQGEMSRVGQRYHLLLFLRIVQCKTPEDEKIRDALVKNNGNQAVAARALNIGSNKVTNFLERSGYYRR